MGADGADGTSAAYISIFAALGPEPIAFTATTLNLYLCPSTMSYDEIVPDVDQW